MYTHPMTRTATPIVARNYRTAPRPPIARKRLASREWLLLAVTAPLAALTGAAIGTAIMLAFGFSA